VSRVKIEQHDVAAAARMVGDVEPAKRGFDWRAPEGCVRLYLSSAADRDGPLPGSSAM